MCLFVEKVYYHFNYFNKSTNTYKQEFHQLLHREYIIQLIIYFRVCGSFHYFFDRRLLLTGKLLNQGSLVAKLKTVLRMYYGRKPLLNTCVVNHHGYVPFVVSTIRSFPHSLPTLKKRITRRVPLVEQEILTLPNNLRSTPGS